MITVLYDSFEDGFYDQDGEGELTIPNGWSLTWREDPEEGVLDRPETDYEYRGEGDSGIRTGRYGSKMASSFATMDAALYRRLEVEPGRLVTAEAWAEFFTNSPGNDATGAVNMVVGVDPTGGTNMESSSIVWGNWEGEDGKNWDGSYFKRLAAEAVAERSNVTIFLRGMNRWAVHTSAVFWDDVTVQTEGTQEGGADLGLRAALDVAVSEVIAALLRLKEAL